MPDAFIIDTVRTASGRGKVGGALAGEHPVDLLATVLSGLVDRTGVDPVEIEDVIVGCVSQVGEQSLNIARHGVLAAGWPERIPATTIDRQCGSSQQALHFAAQGVLAGAYDVVVAAGVESMSRIPMGVAPMSADVVGGRVRARYPDGLVNQGVSAELVADRWRFGREELDEYSAESHRRARAAAEAGAFDREIVEVRTVDADGVTVIHASDETIRRTSADALAGLRPSFATEEMRARFPTIDWKITPGNSSPLTDGASAALIMSEAAVRRLRLRPRARFTSFAVTGDDPILMLTAPIPATRKALQRAGLGIDDIDAYEINEAFAPVPLAWLRELGADPAKLNPHGGAIALGHPLGASGTRLMTTLLNYLETTGGRYGLQAMCEGAGMANVTIIERL